MSKEYQQLRLKDFIQFNPKEKLSKGSIARKITMEHIVPYNRYVSSNTFEEYKGGSKFRNGDTIMARITPCLENGKTAYISSLDQNELAFGSTEFIVLREVYGVSDKKYIYYLMSTPEIRNVAIKSMVGSSGRQRVQQNVLENYIVCLPSLNEQIRIANILSSLDDKIELNRRINENLEQQAQALFKSWFVDFEPFKDGKFVDSELGMIPEGWKVNNIYEYIDVIYGAPYKSSLFNTDKNGYPLIRIRDLKTYTPQFYTQEILPNTEYIYPGDVIAGMDAEFIPTLWLGEKGLLNQRCCKFISKRKNISNYYILYLLMPELLCVQNYKTGTTVSHLGKADIDRFKVITPPIEIIEKFSTLVNPLYNEKIKLACENRIITNLRDTLLPKLMSGELKLSEIETKLDE